jgi:signal transduction histidine kinase/CheY-like chemotaxis protein
VAPRQSIPTITVAFVYLIFLAVFTQGISGTAVSPYTGETYAWTVTTFSEFLYTDWRANLMIISVVSVFVSVVVYNLYVANFLKGEELEAQNTLLEQRVAERTLELAEKTEVAEGANRSKSRFMVAISHELRTPLNAILGMTHIAQNSDDPEKVERSLAQIESSSTLLLDLLSDVLDMSSIETGALRIDHKRFALKKVLAEVVASSEFIASQKAITLATNLDQVLEYTVFGDRLRLAQVLLNLLDNAIKFSAEDGEVELSVKVVEADEHNLEVFFAVTDRGIGMDEVRQSRLFKAFEQGTSDGMKHSGLGLGLSVSQSLVKMMGGTIAVLSEVDKGSTFSFSLNFDLADSTREGAIVIPRLTGKHILSVEDIAINRDILRELVEETDVIVEEAFDGREAVEKFAASPPGYYELIFMDLLMPHLDGFQATAQIRALARDDAPTVPIVALSANAYPEDIEKSLAAGMNSHIAKPLAFETLMVTLREYLG